MLSRHWNAFTATTCLLVFVASCDAPSRPFAPTAAGATAQAAISVTGTETRITDNLAGQYDPAISGNWIVYTDNRGVDMDVWAYDLAARVEIPVTVATGDQELPGIGGGRIAYTDYQTTDILVYDLATGVTVNVTQASGSISLNPDIDGDVVAWEDRRAGNTDIWARQLGQEEFRVSVATTDDRSPSVADGWIAWQSCVAGICDIMLYNVATAERRQVTSTTLDERRPDVRGGRVVYERHGGPDADIVLYDIATGEETTLALPGDQINANISGAYVAFEDLVSGVSHVKIWDLASGETVPIGAPETSSQFLNDIDGTRVVYTDDRYGQLDIFMFEFTIVPDATAEAIRATIAALEQSGAITNHGIARSLGAFLSQAEAAIARGDVAAAAKTLDKLMDFCRQQTPRHITQPASDELIRMITAFRGAL